MKTYYKKVDLRSREAMVAFLAGHFRYDTMNSWNRSTSYANCVKLHRLELSEAQMNRAWELLDVDEVYTAINDRLNEWSVLHDWNWQVGFNGRSSGYLVLYQGALDYQNARTAQCDVCGKLTWHKENVPCTRTGCTGTLKVLEKPRPQIVTYPGRGLDESEDFQSWNMDSLRARVELVQSFDRLCDEVVELFADYCDNYKVVDQEIMVPKHIKVLEAV